MVEGNVADLVEAAAQRFPDKPALVYADASTSWRELNAAVDATAAGLRHLGLEPGDRVALSLPNTPDFATSYFGALRAGLVAVPLNPGYTDEELRHVLGDSRARAVVVDARTHARAMRLRDALEPLEFVVRTGDGEDSLRALQRRGEPVEPAPGGEQLAVVLYTSGTSGRPKGAMLPHRALLANLQQAARIEPPVVTSDDVVLLVLPLFHVYGLNAALGAVAYHGATGVLCERFDPVDTLEQIARHEVTSLVGAPPMYVAWSMLPDVGDAFSSVRVALSGAAPLPAAVVHRILDVTGHHVFEGYGLTETSPVLTTTLCSQVPKPDSIGQPIPGVELKLLDEDGEPPEPGDPGEIVVRGDNVFVGYWPDGRDGPDGDGWFPTGDVAYADDDGDLHLVDRRRELILVSGFNVYPREVEDVLLAHPDVADVAVLGVPHPYTGESVKALVVRRAGAQPSAEELIGFAAEKLARFKCPTTVEFVDELPYSATGKVSKGKLRLRWPGRSH